jgi:hypothetical protein
MLFLLVDGWMKVQENKLEGKGSCRFHVNALLVDALYQNSHPEPLGEGSAAMLGFECR